MLSKRSRHHAAACRAVVLMVLAALLVLTAATTAFGRLVWFEGGAAFAPYTETTRGPYGSDAASSGDSSIHTVVPYTQEKAYEDYLHY